MGLTCVQTKLIPQSHLYDNKIMGSGDIVDRTSNRIADSIHISLLSIVLTAVGSAFMSLPETSGSQIDIVLLIPILITLTGVLSASIFTGPPGFFGVILEVIGAGSLLTSPSIGDFVLLTIGAILVVIGGEIWSPKQWLRLLGNNSSSRGPPRRPPGR